RVECGRLLGRVVGRAGRRGDERLAEPLLSRVVHLLLERPRVPEADDAPDEHDEEDEDERELDERNARFAAVSSPDDAATSHWSPRIPSASGTSWCRSRWPALIVG